MEDDQRVDDSGDRDGDVEASRGGCRWEDVLVGFYYVKPNYPGRSSHVSIYSPTFHTHTYMSFPTCSSLDHTRCGIRVERVMLIEKGKICNAGFVVPPAHRQYGYGMTLGKSYLHYAPALGYKASVFNLVYATNTGSLRCVRPS